MSTIFFELLSRVHTFTIGNWFYTDLRQLNPYILASKGYHLLKPFTIQCSVCHHEILINYKQITEKNEKKLGKELEQKLKKHNQNCIYKHEQVNQISNEQNQKPFTQQDVYLIMDDVIVIIKQTYKLFHQLNAYPLLNVEEIDGFLNVDKHTLKFISHAYKLNWPEKIKSTFFLLIFGWAAKNIKQTGEKSQNNLCLYCNFCGRQVNLSKFKCLNSDQQLRSIHVASLKQSFNPVSEHRYFCFWVNRLPFLQYQGYQIILQQIYDKINQSKTLFSKREPQQTKKIRVELDKYLQNFQLKTSEQFSKIKSIFNQCENMKKLLESQQKSNLHQIHQKDINQFQNAEKRMNEFVQHDVGHQIKGKIKKIKLN